MHMSMSNAKGNELRPAGIFVFVPTFSHCPTLRHTSRDRGAESNENPPKRRRRFQKTNGYAPKASVWQCGDFHKWRSDVFGKVPHPHLSVPGVFHPKRR